MSAHSRVWWYVNSAGKLAAPYERHQKAVPRLPIPTIEESCARFLRAAAPLQSAPQHAATKHAVEQFCQPGGDGQLLQEELKKADAALPRESNYIESLWYRAAYLGPRDPVAINANPGVLLATPADPAQREPLWRAASFLSASAHWVHDLRTAELAPPTAGGGKVPLCMSMLPSVLGCSRMPEEGCDRIQAHPSSTHAAVHWRGGWFSLPLFDARLGTPLSAAAVLGALEALPSAAAAAEGGAAALKVPLGAFTATDRDVWAAARARLIEASPRNASSLAALDGALLVVVLEDDAPATLSARARATLCGEASRRWYDKVMAIVYADGQCGINFEHSPVDGAQMVFMAESVTKRIAAAPPRPTGLAPPPVSAHLPTALTWSVPAPLGKQLDAVRAAVAATSAGLESDARVIPTVSLAWAKRHRLSLDALVQMALQLGYAACSGGRVDSTYEACSTQLFLHGRTECVRSVTQQSVALCAALDGGGGGGGGERAQLAALAAALDAHRTTVQDCQRGHGHERHLLALKVKAAELGRPTPALFEDGGWATVGTSHLSTSGLRSPALGLFCFGPVAADGVGLAYLLQPDGITLNVTSWKGKGPPAAKVADAIAASLQKLRALVEKRPKAPPQSKL
tara:strand:+ start:19 stop:1905 length:1887 start_codon:yes stop_codon:yes gene_type:complete